jgi:LmbE family N-acetylglucosaminyl deacetylase
MDAFFTQALRAVYRGLVPAQAKSTLRLRLLFDERDQPPRPIDAFDARPVLVLAPHMDDEVIGCGGTLRRHVLAGAPATVLFLTDGRRGGPNGAPGGDELVAARKRESRRAADVLGLRELVFLDEPDGELAPSKRVIERVLALWRRVRPGFVYAPSALDVHDDHWAANLVLHGCLAAAGGELEGTGALLRQYEVWTPLLVNRLVDIEGVLADKLRALAQFESQAPQLDLARVCAGLGAYRSLHLGGGRGHAEAFYESTLAEYRVLMERFLEGR